MLEGREITIYTDHRPLAYAFNQKPTKATPRQQRHLDFIGQFTTDIRHISGLENNVADALSRVNNITLPIIVSTEEIAEAQQNDQELQDLLQTPGNLQLKQLRLDGTETKIYCDISTNNIRPYIPKCQRSKISRHVRRRPEHIQVPEERFAHIHLDIVCPLPPSQGYRCKTQHTTAYHPQSNGAIERWHRSLKTAIKCQETNDWVKVLPVVMLGLRNALKEDIGTSAAELLYGTQLRIPGEYFNQEELSQEPFPFLEKLRETMREIRPSQTAHHNKPRTFIHKTLHICTHVFVRVDSVRKPLDQLYEGPFTVLERPSDFCFRIDIRGRPTDISIDRLKPAFLETTAEQRPPTTYANTSNTGAGTSVNPIQLLPTKIHKVHFAP
ncbi:uncharacterized protein [Cardiocondyla obscurior]|uniref:uncharacterized protein n=1 Tax=Cardiocondyla obscurior TaxID=286306 RepID=UPI00396570CC